MILGGAAFSCRFRFYDRVEEATPERENPEKLLSAASKYMDVFLGALSEIALRKFQKSASAPYEQWEWEEGTGKEDY